jgi:methionine-gamma-lyase
LNAGDHMLAGRVLYGCTHALLRDGLQRFGVDVSFVDSTNLEALQQAVRKETRIILLESPTNPDLGLTDIAQVVKWAKAQGILVMVDNTFCTPYLQRPLDLGADLVVHSATKYLNGHGDVIAGFIVGRKEHTDRIREQGLKDLTGAVLGPFEAFLTMRGMKTLSYRMDAHCDNAEQVAEYLSSHRQIQRVIYPGLKSHPQYELARRQMKRPGGMVSFEVKGGYGAAVRLIDHVQMISIAVSLGDTESLIQHPASMTHSSYTAEEKKIAGITDGMIRISVGLEDAADIIADLKSALASVAGRDGSKGYLGVMGGSLLSGSNDS